MASIVDGNYTSGSFWFATLLNFKHIYLYCAPAYGMYLLTSCCFTGESSSQRIVGFIKKVARLGFVVLIVFIITYAPFADPQVLKQIASRLFPFKRGLTHAYWAPNIWSLYNTADKILATIFKNSIRVNFDIDSISRTKPISSTSGLVQEYHHQYLPSIQPAVTFTLVAALTLPLAIKFLLNIKRPSACLFMKGVTIAAFTSFMFGWHVHEKAIIVILLPLIPVSFLDQNLTKAFLRLTLAGTYSLFPLLFQPAEYLTKVAILVAYLNYAHNLKPRDSHRPGGATKSRGSLGALWCKLYNLFDKSLMLAIILTDIYVNLFHGRFNYGWNPMAILNKYEFLPSC